MSGIPSKYPGVRYREHSTRKNGRVKDRYIFLRHKVNGRTVEEGYGWASHGFNVEKANEVLCILRQNKRHGVGPQTLAEIREIEQAERDEAERAAAAARKDIPVTIGDLYGAYIAHVAQEKKSWESDRQIWASRLQILAHMPLAEITTERITAHKRRLSLEFAPASVRHALGLLRRIVRWGASHYGRDWPKAAPDNPLQGVAMPRVNNAKLRYLKRSEVDTLMAWLAEHDPLLHDAATMSLYTGMRRGELERVRCGHVDLDAMIVSIVDPKSGVTRETVSIPDNIVHMLRARLKDRGHGEHLFPSPVTGGEVHSMSPRFAKAVKACGVNDGVEDERYAASFHTLRHTYISWLVMAGVDIRTVQEMARHRSFEMTLRYAHLAPRARRNAANLLAGFVDSSSVPGQSS